MTGDRKLLRPCIYLHFDDLHPVDKRLGDSRKSVCRCDKETIRKVDRRFDEMVAEGLVLLRIKHFEKRRCGIAVRIAGELIDLVHKNQGVHRSRLRQRIDYSSRH